MRNNLDFRAAGCFIRHQGQTIRHVQKHQDINSEFWYLHCDSGEFFDVRDLPADLLGHRRSAILAGEPSAHREAIKAAVQARWPFGSLARYLACEAWQHIFGRSPEVCRWLFRLEVDECPGRIVAGDVLVDGRWKLLRPDDLKHLEESLLHNEVPETYGSDWSPEVTLHSSLPDWAL